MKVILIAASLILFMPTLADAHGGGCRKSSPAGQCCHKETRTGIVHCH